MTLHNDQHTFIAAITATSNAFNIKRHFIEKDYWICHCLQLMSRADTAQHAIFKGGTSLTKAYNIGSRFSEDIDIAIADAHLMTGNQLKTTIRRVAHSMTKGLQEVPKETTSKGSHYHKAYYTYPTVSIVPTTSAVQAGELLLEINSFANPYPWDIKNIRSFITEFFLQNHNEELIQQFDMAGFDVPVLDFRRTLTEKVVSLLRYSLADDYLPQLKAKIRHFYDLHYLLQETNCQSYLQTEAFYQDFNSLLEHDRTSFSKPDGWQHRPLGASPLIEDFHATWQQLQPTYLHELPDLAYRNIPTIEEIEQSIITLFSRL